MTLRQYLSILPCLPLPSRNLQTLSFNIGLDSQVYNHFGIKNCCRVNSHFSIGPSSCVYSHLGFKSAAMHIAILELGPGSRVYSHVCTGPNSCEYIGILAFNHLALARSDKIVYIYLSLGWSRWLLICCRVYSHFGLRPGSCTYSHFDINTTAGYIASCALGTAAVYRAFMTLKTSCVCLTFLFWAWQLFI